MLNHIACSYYNTAAIDHDGKLMIWGSPQSGLLGKDCVKTIVIFDIFH